MPRADQRLYAALLRMGRQFGAAGVPLTGVAGTPVACGRLDWPATLRRLVQQPPPGLGLAGKRGPLTNGAKLLARLRQQLHVLLQAEEHTRDALAEWAQLARKYSLRAGGAASPNPPSVAAAAARAAAAAEDGLALLTRQAQRLADPLQLELWQAADKELQAGGDGPAAVTLDDLAAAVRQQHPDLFPDSSGGHSSSSSSSGSIDVSGSGGSGSGRSSSGSASVTQLRLRQAAALAEGLYGRQRFKHEPFEWVYEGLQPLLLPPRLQRRKLAPLTLGVAAAGVACRLGLPLLPVPAQGGADIAAAVAEGATGGVAAQGALPLDQLRPDVAQRYAGRAQGMAPAAVPWVLLLAGGEDSSTAHAADPAVQQQPWSHVMDACTGQVLEAAAARLKWPELQLAAEWPQHAPLAAWQHMVRTVIQAHQRRGESDLVAHWVYVLLALDPQAAEWGHVLQAGS